LQTRFIHVIAVTIVLTFHHLPISQQTASFLVVWNVGQGQWISHIEPTLCLHFDMGGEKAPWPALQRLCGSNKLNLLILSHWDWDHINFSQRALQRLSQLCLFAPPQGLGKENKKKWLDKIPKCPYLHRQSQLPTQYLNTRTHLKNSNDNSRVVFWQNEVLFPGDTSSRCENLWIKELTPNLFLPLLIVGHHGSRFSSGQKLLQSFAGIRQAVASARRSRYGHPHKDVKQRLSARGVPLISTEIWGNIRWDYSH
jgi:competence protein ComEC